jgi:RsiW-degrading membrane proteinase PrsW (M82 family)
MMIVKSLTGILPVLFFLIVLVILDSYKLVNIRSIFFALLAGIVSALLSWLANNLLINAFDMNFITYSRYLSPLIEETFKASVILFFIRQKKIGFPVDAAIYGFAVGTGFAVTENIYYLNTLPNVPLFLWVIRGFGTAVMHGGTTAIMAIITIYLNFRFSGQFIRSALPGLCMAYILHSFFNHFFFSPVLMTFGQLVIFPLLTIFVYSKSEAALQEWLEAGLDVDVWLLDYINTGRLHQTKIGEYLHKLQNQFAGEVMADMICYIRLNLELAIRAKGIILMRESGFPVPEDPEITEKLTELEFLEKNIGKTGKLALSPLLHTGIQELWQLGLIDKKKEHHPRNNRIEHSE